VYDIGIGDLGMTYTEMMQLTFSELMIRQLGQHRKDEKFLHGVRLGMWATLKPHMRKGKEIEPSDLIKLSFDKAPEQNQMTKTDFMKHAIRN